MPQITLPDGSKRDYENPVSVAEIAESIGPGLAKAALAGRVDGSLVDTSFTIDADAEVAIITERDDDGLEVIRHSCAHLMAQAVQRLFPKAQVTVGPVVEDGFFYDFAFERPFTPEDLQAIEQTMRSIVKENLQIERSILSRKDAIAMFKKMGEDYKVEIIEGIPGDEDLSFYQQDDFIDLCRGPHVPSTGKFKAFKLTSVAGAYWRGNAENEMLQRIHGTAWGSKKDLNLYLQRLEEAEKRDHRKLGKRLDLFHFQEEAPGMAFWHPKGWRIYQVVQDYMRQVQNANRYKEINTPQLVDYTLWEKSGHASKFAEEMFSVESDNRMYAIKPMNCPCHIQVFNQGLKSYRDLPLRFAEFGSCHRYEPSGSMHGLMRVRSFVQDDGHIFCTEDQIQSEVADFMELLFAVYRDFGFDDVMLRLSTRPEKRVGADELWDDAEQALKDALNATSLPWELVPGEGAFYGPKIEYSLKDCMGRVQQCGTIQVDFFLPERLGARYVAEDDSRKTPVMLHRAVLGSFERFIGVLIEHFGGAMPTWLAPEQAIILNITDKQAEYCEKLQESLKNKGFRVSADLRNEKIGFKIREHTLQKIPYLLVVGDKEVESGTVAVRKRGGEDLGTMTFDDFCKHLSQDVASFGRTPRPQP
ncbi:MAG: threonine--tRNA ligase [Gammaproteobacteria bacterium]|jgi:threonyl-tRNA synthetase|nr:threonine--tRNA ligase [Gammaproteobacteria bacterium]MDP6096335.1 threonine--tRNA ligase [Gammaproteobacteria bacterium]MDP7455818.1 threonine--tRNA ligase [Gammaproteobacteria bacterium]HJO10792.1 threonine--tRNA ligase [Gammaproteobacteria bacterium]|tara:strand:- start:5773 stop:7701 length:1929 start_codon:yes stop_codon:yes gene_type:complete